MCGNGENEGSVWEKDSERVHLLLRVSKTCQENTKSKPLCCKRSRRRLRFLSATHGAVNQYLHISRRNILQVQGEIPAPTNQFF